MSKNDNDQRLANRVRTIADEKDHGNFRYETPLVPPLVGISDEPTICYQVNREWNKYISGAISLLLEIAVWKDAQDETYEAIQQVSNLLLGSECGGGMDCDDCLSTSDIIKYINNRTYQVETQVSKLQASAEIAAFVAAGENIQVYNPAVPAIFHTGSPETQLAFCLAAERFAKDLAERLYNFASFQLGLSILTRDIGAAFGWAARALPTVFNAIFKLFNIVGLFGAATYEEMLEVVSDEAAVNELICQLIDIFEDTTTARASYDAAIDAIVTTGGTVNGNKFAQMAKTYCDNTEAYLYFCNLVGVIQGEDLSEYECIDCVLPTYDITFDFTTGQHGWSISQYCPGFNVGTYTAGQGWVTANTIRDQNCNTVSLRAVDIHIPLQFATILTAIEVDFTGVVLGSGYTDNALFTAPNISTTTVGDGIIYVTPSATGNFTRSWSGSLSTSQAFMRCRILVASGTLGSSTGRITRIRVQGIGSSPF